ncbi:MAG: hypothetical protein IPM54_25290 [Polyangiaceae bacterium]|nr:hypothetical protein [Polyangiaceae bacterium]
MVDLEKLRAELRRMRRGTLLTIAERAIEILPPSALHALVGDCVDWSKLTVSSAHEPPSLLEEVQRFQAAVVRREYWEDFLVTSKNCDEVSGKTEAYLAEMDRLFFRCVRETESGAYVAARGAYEELFALIRRVSACEEELVFFVDGGGLWEYGLDWQRILPAYVHCLAETASPDEFAGETMQVLHEFECPHEARILAKSVQHANATQRAALASGLAGYRASRQGKSDYCGLLRENGAAI